MKIRTLGVDGSGATGGDGTGEWRWGEAGETHRREGDTRSWRSSSYEEARGDCAWEGRWARVSDRRVGIGRGRSAAREREACRVPFAGERVAADERENE